MSKRDWGIDEPELVFWYNTRTGQVEEGKLSLDRSNRTVQPRGAKRSAGPRSSPSGRARFARKTRATIEAESFPGDSLISH